MELPISPDVVTLYLEGADLFHLKSVTVEDNEEGLKVLMKFK